MTEAQAINDTGEYYANKDYYEKEVRETKEAVVAVMPSKGTNKEVELSRSVSVIELEAESIAISSDADYNDAAEFGRKLKRALSDVTDFFKPMKEAANKAHREVCDREKIMLKPLQNAESVLKSTMGNYALRKEQEKRAIEEAARRRAQEEADRKFDEAIAQQNAGNVEAAESAMLDAQIMDTMSRSLSIEVEPPKAEGISQSKDWVIDGIDASQVPIDLVGICLRPVDDKAIIRLIRSSKGKIVIPGVTYHETVKTSIRK
jgi:hypothetical protein